MTRRLLIGLNYVALLFLVISAFLGALIQRGQGFEIHFAVSLVSLALTVSGHVGSGIYLAVRPVPGRTRIPLVVLNYVATGFYLWATYAGFMIRQGIPFDYHFTISISSFFFSTSAHVLSALFLALKYRQTDVALTNKAPLRQA